MLEPSIAQEVLMRAMPAAIGAATTPHGQTGEGAGMWTLVSVGLALAAALGTLLGAWIKNGPRWREVAEQARNSDMQQLRQTVAEMRTELVDVRREVKDVTRENHQLREAYSTQGLMIQMISGELSRKDPDNAVLKQTTRMADRIRLPNFGYEIDMIDLSEKITTAVAESAHRATTEALHDVPQPKRDTADEG